MDRELPKTRRKPPTAIATAAGYPDRDCPLCPRLADFRNENRSRKPDWFNAPVPAFGPSDAPLLIVGLAPGTARRQPHRPAVHRRLCRRPALSDIARIRICPRRLSRKRRRRAGTRRLPDRQCRALRAAAEQADARRDQHLPAVPDRAARQHAAAARHRRARPHRPRLGASRRWGCARRRRRSDTARCIRRASAASTTAIIARATTRTPAC